MKNITFLTIKDIVRIHKGQVEEYGGINGIRDEQLLDSAIHMPQAMFSDKYLHKNIYEMAAAYAYHIIKNHPFLDGNKRAGIITALIFLKLNDVNISFEKDQLYRVAVKIATTDISKQEIAQFF